MTRVCRALGALGLAVFFCFATVGVATAAPAASHTTCAPSTSCPSTHPGGKVPGTHHGHGGTRYCVSGYKPGTVVVITNPKTGVTERVTVNSHGNACSKVPLTRGCQTITSRGTGADGKPASNSATVCQTPPSTRPSNGSILPFTGSSLVIPGTVAGVVLLALGAFLVVLTRRRRAGAPAVTA